MGNTASAFFETTVPSDSTDIIFISNADPNSSSLWLLPLQQQIWLKHNGTVAADEDKELLTRQDVYHKRCVDQLENQFT